MALAREIYFYTIVTGISLYAFVLSLFTWVPVRTYLNGTYNSETTFFTLFICVLIAPIAYSLTIIGNNYFKLLPKKYLILAMFSPFFLLGLIFIFYPILS